MADVDLVQMRIPRVGAARINIFMNDGTVSEKFVKVQDFVSMLASKNVGINIVLPHDCIKYSASGNTSCYAILKEEGPQYLNIQSQHDHVKFDRVLIQRPNTIWIFRVRGNSIVSTMVGLVLPNEIQQIYNGDLSILSTGLRPIPFPNVFDNNTICWGHTGVDHLLTIKNGVKWNTFDQIITSYWLSPSNYHLDNMDMNMHKISAFFGDEMIPFEVGSRMSFIKNYLVGKESFPYEMF